MNFPLKMKPINAARYSILLMIMVAFGACKRIEQVNGSDAYIENGTVWAYGSVQISGLDEDNVLVLERNTADQSFDSTTYQLKGHSGTENGGAAKRDIAYVDYHPTNSRALAYAYKLDFRSRNGRSSAINVYAVLIKPGRSYNARRIYLGAATFEGSSLTAKLSAHQNLKLSQINGGVFRGHWAVHYANIKQTLIKPWGGMCNGRVGQQPTKDKNGIVTQKPGTIFSPGQNPGQNPTQSGLDCRPLPQNKDLCGGDPTADGCRPGVPFQAPADELTVISDSDTEHTIAGEGRVFTMNLGTRKSKFLIRSDILPADSAVSCDSAFLAVARTVNGQINGACRLKPAPVEMSGDKKTCGLIVEFVNASSYMEKICNVTTRLKIDNKFELRHFQILKQ